MTVPTDFINDALQEYLPQVRLSRPLTSATNRTSSHPLTIILTGSTGSLGSYIVSVLQTLPESRLQKVYCLNRGADAEKRQQTSLSSRSLPLLDDPRFVFLKADLTSPTLGLTTQSYSNLQDATLIIHNAWTINFVLPGEAFKPHLSGVQHLLHLSHTSPNHPPLFFVSSLGIGYASDMAHIPERIFDIDEVNIAGGYCQSKYVTERLLEAYAASTDLTTAILRVGQLCGPVHGEGVWPHREWLPTLLRAAHLLGVMPDSLGKHDDVDWIPVDVAATIIVEIAEHFVYSASRGGQPRRMVWDIHPASVVFNIANPSTIPYNFLLHVMGCVAPARISGELWVQLLSDAVAVDGTTPGAKLLALYKSMYEGAKPVIQAVTTNMKLASRTGRQLQPVQQRWMRKWMAQWGFRQPDKVMCRL